MKQQQPQVYNSIYCGQSNIECPFKTSDLTKRCEYIYFDVGSHIGVQVRKLFQPERYPEALVKPIFEKYFPADKSNVCAIGFEPNPVHRGVLDKIESFYNGRGWRTIFYPFAAYHKYDDHLWFKSDGDSGHNFWGASLLGGNGEKYEVKGVDLALFVKNIVLYHQPKAVVMKLDIEGSEEQVIPRMTEEKTFCLLDLVMVEMHYFTKEMNNGTLTRFRDAGIRNRGSDCPRWNLLELDDESYLNEAWTQS